jgi:hypothetical protein
MRPNLKKSVTLLELLIAIVLLSVVTIGISSIDIFSRSHVLSSQRRTSLQNEASFVLGHMTKEITRAIGNTQIDRAVFFYINNNGIRIRIDDHPLPSGNGRIDLDDSWIAYRQVGSEIWFYDNAGTVEPPAGPHDVLASHVVFTDFTQPSDTWGLQIDRDLSVNFIDVTIRCRWRPNPPASVDNPQVELRTRIKMPSVSTN